jgi:hypothetical protein
MFSSKVIAQVQPPTIIEINDKSSVTILANGDARAKEEISMSASAFAKFKAYYNPLSILTRELKSQRLEMELTNVNINLDEANNKVTVTYTIKGAAVNKKDYWELKVASESEKVTLSSQLGNVLVFTYVGAVTSDVRWIVTTTVTLPQEAKNINFISDTNTIRYEYASTLGGPQLSKSLLFLIGGVIFILLGAVTLILGRKRKPLLAAPSPPPPPPPASTCSHSSLGAF